MRMFVKLCDSFLSIAVGLALLLAGAYACYCLWDNSQIYSAAENVQAELLQLKPSEGEDGPGFYELLKLNPDVKAWVSMDGTKIDHPVLQGRTNLDYINTDFYGNFALAGSIFLDSRNDPDFKDPYSLLYGHHMDKSAMFGDLDKYLDGKFFEKNSSGKLLVPGKSYTLKVIACVQTRASDDRIFDPTMWRYDVSGILDFAETESLHLNRDTLGALRDELKNGGSVQLLALTTCSSDFTDARTIVITQMTENNQEKGGETKT